MFDVIIFLIGIITLLAYLSRDWGTGLNAQKQAEIDHLLWIEAVTNQIKQHTKESR